MMNDSEYYTVDECSVDTQICGTPCRVCYNENIYYNYDCFTGNKFEDTVRYIMNKIVIIVGNHIFINISYIILFTRVHSKLCI